MAHYQGHGNPYGQMDPYGNIPTPMEMTQEKLEDKANRWQALQSKVCPLDFESSAAAAWCFHFWVLRTSTNHFAFTFDTP